MWPFRKKRTALQIPGPVELEEVIEIIAEKWRVFAALPFRDGVALDERIMSFIPPALDGLVKARPSFAFMPTEAMLVLFANGIVHSGTHSAEEVQEALGIPREP